MRCESSKTRFVPALLGLLALGCISPSPAPPRRYFDAAPSRAPVDFRGFALGRVTAAPHLREPAMAWRLSSVELAFDEDHLWVAEPSALVQHALDASGLVPPVAGTASRLDLHLLAFEGILGETSRARVAFEVRLSGAASDSRRFELEVPLDRRAADALARGTAEALGRLIDELGAWLAGAGPAAGP